jgi:hypothetical protein
MPPLFGSGGRPRGGRGRLRGEPERDLLDPDARGAGSSRGFEARAFELAESRSLPTRRALASAVEAALSVLESEDRSLRPRDSSGRPGGLLILPDLPTVLVPDLHARPAFLASVFAWRPPIAQALAKGREGSAPTAAGGQDLRERPSLASLLAAGKANLVLLGDLFHSESGGAYERWLRAYREYSSDWARSEAMDEEMGRSLAVGRIVLEAKAAFPRFFHCLKGNHDNIADEEGRGDHSFYKFAAEGEMVASWFEATYGGALRARYREFELDLPLLALGKRFAASHAEPAFALDREDIVEYRSRPEVVEALIWTANDASMPGSVARSLEALLGREGAEGALWFGGHRPVGGRYALRASGRFVQFHDPGARRVVLLGSGAAPDPDRDILDAVSPGD